MAAGLLVQAFGSLSAIASSTGLASDPIIEEPTGGQIPPSSAATTHVGNPQANPDPTIGPTIDDTA